MVLPSIFFPLISSHSPHFHALSLPPFSLTSPLISSPLFTHVGGPDSDWPTVRRFYDHWLSFASVKEFAWADIYNLASAPNRKVWCVECVVCRVCVSVSVWGGGGAVEHTNAHMYPM